MTVLIAILSILFIVLTFLVVSKTQAILKGMDKSKSVADTEYLGAPNKFNDANALGLFVFWILSVIGIVWSFYRCEEAFPTGSFFCSRKRN